MFTRVVKMTCKSGQANQACKNINDKVLPILKKQQGFVDLIVLASTTDPDHVWAQSYWNTREDAERYNRDQYPTIREMIQDAAIRLRAYSIYEQRGRQHGHNLDDWLIAEAEVVGKAYAQSA
jgi:heme-degrading monooxygenase HmoA